MKRICIAVVGTLIFAVNSDPSHADSKPSSKGWRPARSESRRLFPADVADSPVKTPESAAFFPDERVQPKPTIRPVNLLKADRPVFPLRTALQPPPAPPTGSKVPPAPKGGPKPGPMPKAAKPMSPMPSFTPPTESGFSAPFDHSSPQLLEVDEVFSDHLGTGVDDCGCDDWCHRHWWFRSTCDMPLRHWYRPESHGYYYFRPYNYRHVLEHSQLAPLLGGNPKAPYETEMFQKFYADIPDIDFGKVEPLKPLEDEDEELPILEDLLKSGKKAAKTDAKKKASKTESKKVKMPPIKKDGAKKKQ